MKRVSSIDFVRGLVMILMTLDHARDFLHLGAAAYNPTDLATTTPALFMTRWITHLCAPAFVLLSGVSAFLSVQQQGDIRAARGFLVKRGLWLVLVNFTLNNFLIFFDWRFGVLFSQVIAAIGAGLVVLGLLLSLPSRVIGIIGVCVIALHNILQSVTLPPDSPWLLPGTWLIGVGYFQLTPNTALLIGYPLLPWIAILLAGFGLGEVFRSPEKIASKRLWAFGGGALILFVLLRALNLYGDPSRWAMQKDGLFTLLSFINTTKQPPSLLFVLMTLGIALLMLAGCYRIQNGFTRWVSVYGKVPLFYWLLHWAALHVVAIGYYLLSGYSWSSLQFSGLGFGRPGTAGGMSLGSLYVTWICVVLLLYPAVRWYSRYKARHPEKTWLRYW